MTPRIFSSSDARRRLALPAIGLIVFALAWWLLRAPSPPAAKLVNLYARTNQWFSLTRNLPAPIALTAPPAASPNTSGPTRPPALTSYHWQPPAPFAPSGRLLQCQLVNALESIRLDTPIIGLVAAEVWHEGNLIIPAGTEVHGQAQADRARERLGSRGPFRLVWPEGRELVLDGVALDRESDASGASWGPTDGSAGLRGLVLRADSLADAKLFLATALAGVADAVQQTRPTAFGSVAVRGARTVGAAATGRVLDLYAQEVLDSIRRDGVYLHVPAGKQFYVYLREPIDLGKTRQASAR